MMSYYKNSKFKSMTQFLVWNTFLIHKNNITHFQDQPDTLIEEIVETFLLVLLTLIHKKRLLNSNYKPTILYDVQLPEMSKVIGS